MELRKFYIIKTGFFHPDEGNKEIDWYDDLKNETTESGYKRWHFYPFEYPLFTTFEDADEACRSDWNDLMDEIWDNFAKVCEYTMTEDGIWYLSHEWFYTTEDDYEIIKPVENDEGAYTLYKETGFLMNGKRSMEILYKDLRIKGLKVY